MGGDIEVFFGGGEGKVLGGKVQSPESRVQSPGSSPAFRICQALRVLFTVDSCTPNDSFS